MLIAILTLLLLNGPVETDRNVDGPNIVYILADDLGWGEVGCYGQEKIRTPVMDKLSREGMRFTQHYSGSAVCAPSRCVLLTGKHTGHAIVRNNWENGGWGADEPEGQYPLPESEETIAEMLKEVDDDGSGEIDFAEFLQFMLNIKKLNDPAAQSTPEEEKEQIERKTAPDGAPPRADSHEP